MCLVCKRLVVLAIFAVNGSHKQPAKRSYYQFAKLAAIDSVVTKQTSVQKLRQENESPACLG
jgi:hypothetical protein